MAKVKRSSLFPTDEELGKRDDDRRPSTTAQWVPKTVPNMSSWRKRRLLAALLALFLVYVFVKNIPNDLGPAQTRYANKMGTAFAPPGGMRPYPGSDQRASVRSPPSAGALERPKGSPRGSPPAVKGSESILDQTIHSFDGPVRFYYLAASLHAIAKTMGQEDKNKNVMFAASSLKSAAAIIPLACEMARWKRNYVHVVLMGRDEMPLDDIKTINGVDDDSCKVYWHDARPDYAIYATDARMEISVAGALKHIYKFMHPQAIVTSGSLHEDAFFTRAMRRKTKELRQTLIQIPQEKPDQMSWLTRLDASSLSAWHTATIDLLVQAPPDSSGSVIRLLKSLAAADFDGFEPPRLTIELPAKLNDVTSRYLDTFEWPPATYDSHLRNSQLVLRRRIPEKRIDSEHASIRFIESFYPADDQNSHVLVLSPQSQLSPVFFHTLKYYLLEYKYSESAWMFGNNIFGISLESPSTHLNGTAAFKPPVAPGEQGEGQTANGLALYLWQAPNSNAALYFADKWIELHSFLTQHLTAVRHPSTKDHHASRPKLISSKNPSWTEHFLDLMRTRGYYMLYPSLPAGPSDSSSGSSSTPAESLVIVHNELYTAPEEFTSPPIFNQRKTPEDLDSDAVLDAPADYLASHDQAQRDAKHLNNESPLLKNLRAMVPEAPDDDEDDDDEEDLVATSKGPKPLPMPYNLPLLDFKGNGITHDEILNQAKDVAADYRRDAGGCPKDQARYVARVPGSHDANDLFCVKDSDVPDVPMHDDSPPSPPSTPNNEPADAAPNQSPTDIPITTTTTASQEANSPTSIKAAVDAAKAAAIDAAAEFHVPAATDPDEVVTNALPLTPAERAELDDWERAKAKGVGDKPPPDTKGSAEMDELHAKTAYSADGEGTTGSVAAGGISAAQRQVHDATTADRESTKLQPDHAAGQLMNFDLGDLEETTPRAAKALAEKAAAGAAAAAIAAGGSTEGSSEYRRLKNIDLDPIVAGAPGASVASGAETPAGLGQPAGVGVDDGPEADAEAEAALLAVEEEVRKLTDRAREIEEQDRAAETVSPGDAGPEGETVDRGV